jgi:hypothetical protein
MEIMIRSKNKPHLMSGYIKLLKSSNNINDICKGNLVQIN